ncbi:hypothetical protein EE612_058796 [Oryza sativa]|nr:hypothetical protein EE612_058796 [Oryza sativa]
MVSASTFGLLNTSLRPLRCSIAAPSRRARVFSGTRRPRHRRRVAQSAEEEEATKCPQSVMHSPTKFHGRGRDGGVVVWG